MTFQTLHELLRSICPASFPGIPLSTLSLALWAYGISFLFCLSSNHSRHSGPKSFPPYPFPGSVSLCSNATSLVRSYFSLFSVFLFIRLTLSLPPLNESSVSVWTCPIYHCCILYVHKSANTQERWVQMRRVGGGGRKSGRPESRSLPAPRRWWGCRPAAVRIVSVQRSFAA